MPIDTHTKILATIGPSTASKTMIEKLVKAGVDAFRFNFSHGTHEEHAERLQIVRDLSAKYKRHLTVIADLQGPKLRVGTFKTDKVLLKKGQKFTLDMQNAAGDETRVTLPHKEIFDALKIGDKLLLNDGNIELEVVANKNYTAQTIVRVGGFLSAHKGVNLPNVRLPISAITEKDKKDLKFALDQGVDWVCLSFVQSIEDVRMARKLIGKRAWIISKLEKPSAIDELDDIIKESDGIMVARGDLGVECPIQTVPVLQKRIVKACRKYARPVIVATQMLESMIVNPTPTRAEVSDVATAVYDGADAVMLSAETAAGSYPSEAVEMMHQIIKQVEENDGYYSHLQKDLDLSDCDDVADAITYAAAEMSQILPNIAAVVTYTSSGITALSMARERPTAPILSLTASAMVAQRLGIVWGVKATVCGEFFKDFNKIRENALNAAKQNKLGKKGDYLVVTAGYPVGQAGMTNLLHTLQI
ncbi:MAG: pyruvate kinase [Alphaproteobacteria bacterium]|nr:pyruvate kinase [Alphaproteobacteria bacterium]